MARRADDQRLQIVHLPLYFLHQSIKVHNVPRASREGTERSYRILKKYLDSMKPESEVKEEEYTPFEHLRKVKENSDFYALEYTVDVNRDILGKA